MRNELPRREANDASIRVPHACMHHLFQSLSDAVAVMAIVGDPGLLYILSLLITLAMPGRKLSQ